jgi:hypothetical protein
MPLRVFRLILLSVVLLSLVPIAARADTPCWTMLDAAIARRAKVTLPPYLSYDVVRSIENDRIYAGRALVTTQSVLLRTLDGQALIVNSLYGNQPMHTNTLDPGLPFVGPSGPNRDSWFADENGHAIAIVHAHAGKACDDLGPEAVDGRRTEHLRVTPTGPQRPGLRDMWIGLDDGEIWRAVVAQPIDVSTLVAALGAELADCTVEVSYQADGAYIRRITYRLADLKVSATYEFSNYRALTSAPPGSFPSK